MAMSRRQTRVLNAPKVKGMRSEGKQKPHRDFEVHVQAVAANPCPVRTIGNKVIRAADLRCDLDHGQTPADTVLLDRLRRPASNCDLWLKLGIVGNLRRYRRGLGYWLELRRRGLLRTRSQCHAKGNR